MTEKGAQFNAEWHDFGRTFIPGIANVTAHRCFHRWWKQWHASRQRLQFIKDHVSPDLAVLKHEFFSHARQFRWPAMDLFFKFTLDAVPLSCLAWRKQLWNPQDPILLTLLPQSRVSIRKLLVDPSAYREAFYRSLNIMERVHAQPFIEQTLQLTSSRKSQNQTKAITSCMRSFTHRTVLRDN